MLYQARQAVEKRLYALSGPPGGGKAFKRFIRLARLWNSVKTLYQTRQAVEKRLNALSGPPSREKAFERFIRPARPRLRV